MNDVDIQHCGEGMAGTVHEVSHYDGDGTLVGTTLECIVPSEEAAPQVTLGMVVAAFQSLPFPDSELTLNPTTRSLVNLDTIFSTEADPFTESVTLLGQRVDLRITPDSYTWHHGDSTSQATDWPGTPWRESTPVATGQYITHTYTHDGGYAPLVDTTWSATYRVNGGPWGPVPGTVTVDGDPVDLTVVEAPPVLTGR